MIWITDIEVFNDYFLAVFKEYNKDHFLCFEISKQRNDFNELSSFFQSNIFQIYPHQQSKHIIAGFNILGYDLIVLLDILTNKNTNNKSIQEVSQYLLSDNYHTEEFKAKKKNIYNILYGNLKVLDVYKMYKWDDDSRRASLKWIAANLRMNNIMESPIPFNISTTTREDRDMITSYCKNDILVVEEIIHQSKDMIRMRHTFRDTIKGNTYSLSNTSLGYAIITNNTKINKSKIRYTDTFKIKDILYPNIELSNQDFLNKLKDTNVDAETKISYNYTLVNTDGSIVPCTLGMGGIHGCIESGIYQENEEYEIMDIDGTSYYPYQAIQYDLYPRSAGKPFVEKMKYLFEERKKLPKSDVRSKGYKEALNSVIGMTKLKGSSIYDHKYFYTITINGQLMLLSICEQLAKVHPEIKILYLNTDGFAIQYPRAHRQAILSTAERLCRSFRISPEFTPIHAFYILNVNNYISVIKQGALSEAEVEEKIKEGAYYYNAVSKEHNIPLGNPPTSWYQYGVYDEHGNMGWHQVKSKEKGIIVSFHDLELHRDFSNFASKKAIYNYLLFNIGVMQSILNNHNLFDFLFHVRRNKNTHYVLHPIMSNGLPDYTKEESLDYKILRYININPRGYLSLPKDSPYPCGVLKIGGKTNNRFADKKASIQLIINNVDAFMREHFHNHLDHQYYVSEASRFIAEIQKPNLFVLS